MTGTELAARATEFAKAETFYEYGGWGQTMSKSELERLAERYPKNKPINYNNVGKWGFDCICFIKGLMAGVTVNHHVDSYQEMKKNPIGDCTNVQFLEMLYDRCRPEDAPAGYGIATKGHAALSLGSGRWIDVNRTGSGQDGVAVHIGGYPADCIAGKIPGVDYSEIPPVSEKAVLMHFCEWLVDSYLNNKG